MWDFLKNIVSFWSTEKSDPPENLKHALTVLEDKEEENSFSLPEGCKTLYRTGVISRITENYGLIDDRYYFSTSNLSRAVLQVGIHVAFELYSCSDNEEWRVYRIYNTISENWEETEDNEVLIEGSDREPEEDTFGTRTTIVSQVVRREGRDVVFSSGDLRCNLDDVTTEFLPLEGM